MAEYIERETAIAKLTALEVTNPSATMTDAKRLLADMPAADVAPVVHGRWLCVDTDTEQFFLCNRCKKKEFWESNYCCSCGARMDGDSYAKEN